MGINNFTATPLPLSKDWQRLSLTTIGTIFNTILDDEFYRVLFIVSSVTLVLLIVCPGVACCCGGENKGIAVVSVLLAIVCMYLFWLVIFLSQINPLIGPTLDNTTIAWVAEVWGDPAL